MIPEIVKRHLEERGVVLKTAEEVHEAKCAFVTVYQPIAGFKAVQYWWNAEEFGGFHEPWQTGFCAYGERARAVDDAISWARAEELPVVLSSEDIEALRCALVVEDRIEEGELQ